MTATARPTLRILGSRGIPAAHGGFETFAEQLSLYLVARGWRVIVYCQEHADGGRTRPPVHDLWRGVERVRIAVPGDGAIASMVFDWHCIAHAGRHRDLCLTLGYNTALFNLRLRAAGIVNLVNMDGIEWRRAKWGALAKAWFWLNDWAGCWLADHLIADHPDIHAHLRTRTSARRISTIPYGAVPADNPPVEPLAAFGLRPGGYLTLIARPEPENSILDAVRGFSCRARGLQLVVLGAYCDDQRYHRAIQDAASDEVRFLGAIYDPAVLASLRAHSVAHVHGHQVGGTNPSLVEALAAGNAVIAHDNRFNRWVAADGAQYFRDAIEIDQVLSRVLASPALLQRMRQCSLERFAEAFQWDVVLAAYEALLLRLMASGGRAAALASVGATAAIDAINEGQDDGALIPWPLRRAP
jgi:glycosyltransferase involved in cell wall biosynthesis